MDPAIVTLGFIPISHNEDADLALGFDDSLLIEL